jgi:glycosyltransferase involved in cell wall biosynthesis
MEAIAAEVALLRRHYPASVAWGLTHRHWAQLSWGRGFGFHPRLHLPFRLLTRALEPAFQLNHVVGSLGDWFYLEGPRRRPTLLTMAAFTPPVDAELLDRVARFAVEYPAGRPYLERLGIDKDRIRLIFPPVDLERFTPADSPQSPFTVLFASSPDRESALPARGVPQLLDAAARRPRMRFRLLWRPWGDSVGRVRRWIAERGLGNVELAVGRWRDMARQYRRAQVTVAPFANGHHFKPAPNSLVESLACGRPVVLSEEVGLAELVREGRAGRVCPPTGEALADSFDRVEADWRDYSRNARRLAERWFGVGRFLDGYDRLYREVLGR